MIDCSNIAIEVLVNDVIVLKAVGPTEDKAKFNVCIEGISKFK